VLTIRDARSLIGASAASQLGDWLYNAALLGYVYAATGSAAWVGAATICRLIPYAVLGPVGGMVADRYDRRRILIAGDCARFVLMLVLAGVVAADGHVALVIALTALTSAAGSAERPAAMALLPRLVGETRLGSANALLHTVQDLGVVIGPALGAVLIAFAPASTAFAVNAGTFAVSGLLISSMRRASTPMRTGTGLGDVERAFESAGTQIGDGIRVVRTTPFVMPLMIVVAMAEFTYGAQTVQLVLYAQNRLDLGPQGYGYLLAAVGAGGLMSATINGRLASSTRVSTIVVAAGVTICVTQLVYAASDALVLALAVTVLGGVGIVSCEVVAETAIARVVPADFLGRVMGVLDSTQVVLMVLGALLAPILIANTSLRASLWVLGGAAMLVTITCLASLRGLDAVSRRRADELASRVAVLERLPIAADAPRMVLEQLAAASQICSVPAGVDVVVEGAPAHAFYAVIEGSVVVHRDEQPLAHLGAGSHFGERGLLDNAPRNASVTTEQTTSLLRLDGATLLDALQFAPNLRSVLDRSQSSAVTPVHVAGDDFVDDPDWNEPGVNPITEGER
jgi:MFS family permease